MNASGIQKTTYAVFQGAAMVADGVFHLEENRILSLESAS